KLNQRATNDNADHVSGAGKKQCNHRQNEIVRKSKDNCEDTEGRYRPQHGDANFSAKGTIGQKNCHKPGTHSRSTSKQTKSPGACFQYLFLSPDVVETCEHGLGRHFFARPLPWAQMNLEKLKNCDERRYDRNGINAIRSVGECVK